MLCTTAILDMQKTNATSSCGPNTSCVVPRQRALFPNLQHPDARHSFAIGGHRGMGANLCPVTDKDDQVGCMWRENTIKSFLKALEHGAHFIELDVQVTKDGVPVVWHDDVVIFDTGGAASVQRVRDLTFHEFQSIGRVQNPTITKEESILYRNYQCKGNGECLASRWTCIEEDALPSLEQVLEALPPTVGINIEIKLPKSCDQSQIACEGLDFTVSAILLVVEKYCKPTNSSRSIIFSSFNADVVEYLKRKQPDFNVMLLVGEEPISQESSLEVFIFGKMDWAYVHGVDGVVLDSNILYKSPHIIEKAKSYGLVVMTYGSRNNAHEWILKQFQLGINGAIVDNVQDIVSNTITLCT